MERPPPLREVVPMRVRIAKFHLFFYLFKICHYSFIKITMYLQQILLLTLLLALMANL